MTEPHSLRQSNQVPEAVQHLLTTIDELRGELREIAYLRQDETIASERLRQWKRRASTTLEQLGATTEAEDLRKATGVSVVGDPFASLRRRADAKDAVLVSFREELCKHPDFWLQDMANAEATPAVAIVVTSRQLFLGHGHSHLWRRVLEHLRGELHLDVKAWESESRAGRYNNEVLEEGLLKAQNELLPRRGAGYRRSGRRYYEQKNCSWRCRRRRSK